MYISIPCIPSGYSSCRSIRIGRPHSNTFEARTRSGWAHGPSHLQLVLPSPASPGWSATPAPSRCAQGGGRGAELIDWDQLDPPGPETAPDDARGDANGPAWAAGRGAAASQQPVPNDLTENGAGVASCGPPFANIPLQKLLNPGLSESP